MPPFTTTMDAPTGREGDLRDLLALLQHDRLVAVVGYTGIGKTTLLDAVARHFGVPRLEGQVPETVDPSGVLVVDASPHQNRRSLRNLMRRVQKAGGRLMVSATSAALVPAGMAVYRLYGLPLPSAAACLPEEASLDRESVAALVGGHPQLIHQARALLQDEPHPASLVALREEMATRVRPTYLDSLPRSARKVAALLAAGGGWLPAAVEVPGFDDAVQVLVDEGLAELGKLALEASPVVSVVAQERLSRKELEAARSAIVRARRQAPSWSHLAEAHVLRALEREDDAVATLREGLRLSRGTARSVPFLRSLAHLAMGPASPLSGLARMGMLFHRYGSLHSARLAVPRIEALVAEGFLEPTDAREARTFLAFAALETEGLEPALSALNRCAEEAAEAGDAYAEAQALLWETWTHVLADHNEVARHIGEETVRKGRKARAPVVVERAHFAVARAEHALGRFDRAEIRLDQALRLARRTRLEDDEVIALDGLAENALSQGRPSEAATYLERADAIVSRVENLARKGDLDLARGAVALRRGHVKEAQQALYTAATEVASEVWTRDILRAEAALAAARWEEAAALVGKATPHPANSRSWHRRRAVVASALNREGMPVDLDFQGAGSDGLVELLLARNAGDLERAIGRLETLERHPAEDWFSEPILAREALALRLMEGRFDEAFTYARRLRAWFSKTAAPTSVILFLEAVEAVVRGELATGSLKAANAHRVARSLGQRRVEEASLILLGTSQLGLGRKRGASLVLRRAERMGRDNPSPAWAARRALLRILMALRFGGSVEVSDLKIAASGPDLLAAAMARRIRGETVSPHFSRALQWVEQLLLGGEVAIGFEPGPAPAPAREAVELSLDGRKREVVFAGGKRVSFGRRRVLWRVLWHLWEAKGGVVEPEELYVSAWQLPFNASRLNSLYVGIRRLRLLVEPDPSAPRVIVVGGNGGYRMDVTRVAADGPSPLGEP